MSIRPIHVVNLALFVICLHLAVTYVIQVRAIQNPILPEPARQSVPFIPPDMPPPPPIIIST